MTVNKSHSQSCTHHWLIETSTAVSVKGVCKLCGAEKNFDNHREFPTHRNQLTEMIKIAHAQKLHDYRNIIGEQL
jgi:hypothetical protein